MNCQPCVMFGERCAFCGASGSGCCAAGGRQSLYDAAALVPAISVGSDGKESTIEIVPVLTHGPGTELSKLLKKIGIEPTPTCSCRAKAAQMDAWGCDECSKAERIEEVVGVMREEAKARGLPFIDAVGRMLVKRAIHNARKATIR
jgi:hypothetical protein